MIDVISCDRDVRDIRDIRDIIREVTINRKVRAKGPSHRLSLFCHFCLFRLLEIATG